MGPDVTILRGIVIVAGASGWSSVQRGKIVLKKVLVKMGLLVYTCSAR